MQFGKFVKMLKTFVLLFFVAVVPLISAEREMVGLSAESVIYDKKVASKISSGTPAVKGHNLDYALLTVIFINQAQICGGSLVSAQWIL